MDKIALSDGALGLLELKRDMIFHTIPKDKYAYYVTNALRMGEELAEDYIGEDIEKLIKQAGIDIVTVPTSGSYYKVRFRARFYKKKDDLKILLYQDTMNEFVENCKGLQKEDVLTREIVRKIYLAHEFFHYIEDLKGKETSEHLDKVNTTKFMFRKIWHFVGSTNEIAAYAFSKKVLGLNNLPNIYDYVYLQRQGKLKEGFFEKAEAEWQNIIAD